MLFYHRTKRTFFLEEVKRERLPGQNRTPHRDMAPDEFSVEDQKRTWILQRLPDATPRPIRPNVFC